MAFGSVPFDIIPFYQYGAYHLGAYHLGAYHFGVYHLGAYHLGAYHLGAYHLGAYHFRDNQLHAQKHVLTRICEVQLFVYILSAVCLLKSAVCLHFVSCLFTFCQLLIFLATRWRHHL